jgi:GTPase
MHEDKNGVLTHLHSLHPKHYAGFAAALNDGRAASVHVHVVIVVVIVVVVVVVITRCDFVAYGQGMQKTFQRFFM